MLKTKLEALNSKMKRLVKSGSVSNGAMVSACCRALKARSAAGDH